MDLLQLQYFQAIAKCGSMTKAARMLFVTQPNLSICMTRLEEDIGVKLFERRKGKITLTENGRIFLEYVDRALDDLDTGIETLRQRENISSRSIRLVSSQPDIISDVLHLSYPPEGRIPIKEMTCPNEDVCDMVLGKSVDLGLLYGTPRSNALEYSEIARSERVLALNKNNPLAAGKSVSLSELTAESFICNHCRDDMQMYEDIRREKGISLHVRHECDHLHMEITLLCVSAGVSILPVSALRKMLRDSPDLPVTGVRIADELPPAVLGAVRSRGTRLSPAALDFLSHMEELFRDDEREAQAWMDKRLREEPDRQT